MAKKIKLDVKYIPDFVALGLFASPNNYRLCWLINKAVNLNLTRKSDILLTPFGSEKPELFSFFFYKDNELNVAYYLLNNRKGQRVLLPEPKNLDYLLLMKSKDFRIDINELVAKLRNIPQIITAVWFKEQEKMKNLNNLLYDFEIALIEKPA